MEEDNKDLTQEELDLQQAELDKKAAAEIEPTEEQIEAAIKKKFGVSSADLIKKEDQVKVLSDAEKAELEEKKNSEVLKVALENNWFTKKEYDSYLEAKGTDEISLVKKKFIDDNPDLGKDAENIFNSIFKVDEDDDIEDGEDTKPNRDKKAAKALAKKIADSMISTDYDKIINVSKKYESYQKDATINKQNAELITKSIAEIPKRMEMKVGENTFGIELTDDDIKEAYKLVVDGTKGAKDLKADEIKGTATAYLLTKNIKKFVEEAVTVAVKNAEDEYKRGAKGIIDKEDKGVTSSDARDFLKRRNIPV